MADDPDRPQSNPKHGEETPLSLLERARARDENAWRQIIQLYQPLVRYWCGRGGIASSAVEDVAQEVFTAASTGLSRFRRDRPGDTFRGWLRGITRNQILMHFRRNRGEPQAEGGSGALQNLREIPEPLPTPEDKEKAEVSDLYRRALDQVRGEFEERTWQAFWLTAVEGRSPGALTNELEMTTMAIRQAKSRVLRRLKQELGELLE